MSCLENLPTDVLTCLFKHMQHEAKLSLRQTSKRMFEIVTALDETFNYWTFDPCMKEDLPKFVLESDKSFQIHIKDLDKKWESVRKDDENDESDNDEEERNEEVQRVVKFISKHAQRIVSFKVSCDMDCDEHGLAQDLLDELADVQPNWKNLMSFEVINTNAHSEDFSGSDDISVNTKDISKLFKFCQKTLEKVVFVGMSLAECQDLRLLNLKTLLINSCNGSEEFVRSLAITDNFSNLEEIVVTRSEEFGEDEDVDITDLLSSDLSKLKKLDIDQAAISLMEPLQANCVNLKSLRLTMNVSAAGLEDFLILCSPTLEVLDIKSGGTDMDDDELDFSKLAAQSWMIKDLRLELTNEFRGLNHYKDLEKFLNRCPFLEKLSLEAEGSNIFNAIDSDDMDDYHEDMDNYNVHEDMDDSYNVMKDYSGDMEDDYDDDSDNDVDDSDNDIDDSDNDVDDSDNNDDDSDNNDDEDESDEEGSKQTNDKTKSNNKLKKLSLKYLRCPTYFLKQISAKCCEHISELHIGDTTGGCADLKFPGLNLLTVDRREKHLVNILFENAQVKETYNPLFGYKYERAFTNATESSRSNKNVREPARNLLRPKARV